MASTNALRALMLLTQSWAYRVSVTPPNPPPPKTDQKSHGDTMVLPVYWNRWVWDSLYYTTALVEVAAMAFAQLPSELAESSLSFPRATESQRLGRAQPYIPPEAIFGWFLTIAGTLLRIWCYRTLASSFTFELSLKEDHKLIRSGPYAYVRHPSYTGLYAVIIGSAMLTYGRGGWWSQAGWDLGAWRYLAVVHLLWEAMMMRDFWRRTKLEDKVLHEHFKEEWEEWVREVPERLIPGVL